MSLPHFPELVLADLLERLSVQRRIALDGDLRRHAPERVNSPAMTGANHQLGVALEKRLLHGDLSAIGQHALRAASQLLDVAEDVIPAAAVQPGRVIPQLPQDLVGLERGENGLDQDRGPDGSAGNPHLVLREVEDLVPEPRLEVTLELWEVVVRPRAARDERGSGVIEREAEIE